MFDKFIITSKKKLQGRFHFVSGIEQFRKRLKCKYIPEYGLQHIQNTFSHPINPGTSTPGPHSGTANKILQ